MKKLFFKPSDILSKFVDRYIYYEVENNLFQPKALPGGGEEMIIVLDSSYSFINSNNVKISVPTAFITSLRKRRYKINFDNKVKFLAIRFNTGMIRHFISCSQIEFYDSIIAIDNIWGNEIKEFVTRVTDSDLLSDQLNQIEKFLIKKLEVNFKQDNLLDVSTSYLYKNFNNRSLQSFINYGGVSQKKLERHFKNNLGVTPKYFQQLARFKHTIRELLISEQKDYLPIALKFGYYDQSHFIKEFKSFTGETPSEFLKPQNFLSNFYNKSWQD